jgi:hypothetical protein
LKLIETDWNENQEKSGKIRKNQEKSGKSESSKVDGVCGGH